jgi:hypothetical protein
MIIPDDTSETAKNIMMIIFDRTWENSKNRMMIIYTLEQQKTITTEWWSFLIVLEKTVKNRMVIIYTWENSKKQNGDYLYLRKQ